MPEYGRNAPATGRRETSRPVITEPGVSVFGSRSVRGRAGRCAVICLLGCGATPAPPPKEFLLPQLSTPVVSRWSEDSTWTILPLATHGAGSGPLGFSAIVGLAVRHDGALAVADHANCSVTIITRPEGRFADRFGTCGDGPAEFRQIGGIAFLGDSLLVYDRSSNAITVLGSSGQEVARVRLALPSGTWIGGMRVAGDSTLLLLLERLRLPGLPDSAFHLVAVASLVSGKLTESMIGEPKAGEDAQNYLRRKPACVRDDGTGPVVVAMNDWSFEGVGMSIPGREETFHFVTPHVRVVPGVMPGGERYAGNRAEVGCGSSGAVFKLVRLARRAGGGMPAIDETLLEMRQYDGSLLLRKSLPGDTALLHGSLGAMHGDTLFVFSNHLRDFPVIGEYVVRPRGL